MMKVSIPVRGPSVLLMVSAFAKTDLMLSRALRVEEAQCDKYDPMNCLLTSD